MLAQRTKIINADPSATGAAAASSGDWVSLGKYNHFTGIVNFGDAGASGTIALYKGTSATGAGATLTKFHYWYNTSTTASDTLVDGGESTSAVAYSSGDNQLWIIEADSSDIQASAADYDFVSLRTTPTGACNFAVSYILSDARYADDSPPTAIS
jgi:hypothetical protein